MNQSIRKLYRSRHERIIAGVAGGLSEYFSVDPVLIRIIFVALALVHGLGILIYIVFMLIIPNEEGGDVAEKIASFSTGFKKGEEKLAGKIKEWAKKAEADKKPAQAADKDAPADKESPVSGANESGGWFKDKKRVVGLAVALVGLVSLLNGLFDVSWFRWDIFWPIALIIVGLYLVARKTDSA
ncbi:MAG: PspC domain-containing protein [Candidatus Pacebacteria bacterium]|nr:PspC domain-containing protein [Candidatus Paceibacterota bacterium]